MALGTPVAGAAAYSASGGTTVAPAYPAGILATDAVLLFVGQKPSTANGGTVTTPTGWTLRDELTAAGGYGTTLGADTGNTNLRVYSWNTPVAGQTGTLSVTLGVNNVTWAFMVRVPSGGGALSYGSADGQRTTTPTSPMSIALTNGATATDFASGDRAIWAMCIPTDVTTPAQFSAQSITATGATFGTATEFNEPDSTTGNDIGGYSAWAAVTAGSSTVAPTVTATLAGTLTNVRGPVVLVRVREAATPPAQTLTPSLYTNANTFHNPSVLAGTVTLTASPVENTSVFYAPTVSQIGGLQTLTPDLYSNTSVFYAPTVTRGTVTLTAARLDGTQAFYAPTVSPGAVTLTSARYDSAQTFYSPTVAGAAVNLTAARYDNANTFYAATVTAGAVTLTPDRLDNAQTYFAASISTGAAAISPARYDNSQTFYGPTVTAGEVTLTATRYDNAQTFYSPTVTLGAITLAPSLVANAQSFYSPSITQGPVTLTAALYSNSSTLYAPTVSPGAVSLAPARVDNSQSFYSATISLGASLLLPSRLDNAQSFYGPSLGLNLAFPGYVAPGYIPPGYVQPPFANTSTFFSATVTPGEVALAADRYDNSNQIFPPTVQLPGAPQNLVADLYANANAFYSSTVTQPGEYFPPAGGIGSKPIRPQDYQPMFTGRSRKRRQQDIVFLGG